MWKRLEYRGNRYGTETWSNVDEAVNAAAEELDQMDSYLCDSEHHRQMVIVDDEFGQMCRVSLTSRVETLTFRALPLNGRMFPKEHTFEIKHEWHE